MRDLTLHPVQTFSDLFEDDGAALDFPDTDGCFGGEFDVDDVAMILHSSGERPSSPPSALKRVSLLIACLGSTGHPKPVYWTHKRMVSRGTTSCTC